MRFTWLIALSKRIPIFSPRKAPISGEGRPENVGKMDNNRDIYCYASQRVINFEREH